MGKKKTRKSYSKQYKLDVIQQSYLRDNISELASELGLRPALIYKWRADEIFQAFNRHRKGSPYKEQEPKKELLDEVYAEIIKAGVFDEKKISDYVHKYEEAEKEAITGAG